MSHFVIPVLALVLCLLAISVPADACPYLASRASFAISQSGKRSKLLDSYPVLPAGHPNIDFASHPSAAAASFGSDANSQHSQTRSRPSSHVLRHPSIRLLDDGGVIGPNCTQLAHNDWLPPGSNRCPMDDSPPQWAAYTQDYPANSSIPSHIWPAAYTLDWTFYFIASSTEYPPFPDPEPPAYDHLTLGKTWYAETLTDPKTGRTVKGAMREHYYNTCIAIFFDGPLHTNQSYSCDFVILNEIEVGYLILHQDRPVGAPECCIIGRPFHAPPRNFFKNLYLNKWSKQNGDTDHTGNEPFLVDWGGLTLPGAGLFAYGFHRDLYPNTNYSIPYAFFFSGIPDQMSSWQYQRFYDFNPQYQPNMDDFHIPDSCASATVCPGWS